jgi:hypothetical protein
MGEEAEAEEKEEYRRRKIGKDEEKILRLRRRRREIGEYEEKVFRLGEGRIWEKTLKLRSRNM